jgi:MT0933-like antitoxin protein
MAGMGDKAKDFLNSDKGEQASDKGLDKAGDLADQKTGGTHDAQIDKGRDLADGKLGNE